MLTHRDSPRTPQPPEARPRYRGVPDSGNGRSGPAGDRVAPTDQRQRSEAHRRGEKLARPGKSGARVFRGPRATRVHGRQRRHQRGGDHGAVRHWLRHARHGPPNRDRRSPRQHRSLDGVCRQRAIWPGSQRRVLRCGYAHDQCVPGDRTAARDRLSALYDVAVGRGGDVTHRHCIPPNRDEYLSAGAHPRCWKSVARGTECLLDRDDAVGG